MLTNDELKLLESSTSEKEWNATCDTIKNNHGGYPHDWYEKVILSGLMGRVANRWGGDDQIHITAL